MRRCDQGESRKLRRLGWASALTLLTVGLVALPPAMAADEPTDAPPSATAEGAAGEPATAQQAEPAPPAERQESATAYEDLDREQAAALAASEFPDYLDALDDSPLANPDDEILRYTGPHTMIVDPAGSEQRQLAISSTPLQIENPAGDLRPLETDLEPTPAGYEPERSGLDLSFPDELAEGIELPDQGVGFGFAAAEGASEPKPIEGSAGLFYSDVATDTDLVVSPIYAGFSFALQLRSARSPERMALPLDLPKGAELELDSDTGFARIDLPGSDSLTISAPIALDADGLAVESRFGVNGETLVLHVSHAEQTPSYPILVDPVVINEQLIAADDFETDPQTRGWTSWEGNWSTTAHGNNFNEFVGAAAPGYWTGGLWVNAVGPTSFAPNEHGEWRMIIPNATTSSAYFNYVQFQDIRNYRNGGGFWPATRAGIYSAATNNWIAGPLTFGTTEFHPSYWVGPTNNYNAKRVVFELFSGPSGAYLPQNTSSYAHLSGYTSYIADLEWPTVTGGSQAASPGPSTWIKDDTQTSATFSAHDGGIGIKQMRLKGGPTESQAVNLITRQARTGGPTSPLCEGWNVANACPQNYSSTQLPANEQLTFNTSQLPEGRNNIYAQAFDVLTKYTAPNDIGDIKVDRSTPVIGEPAGSLYAQRNGIDDNEDYRLTISANDGSPGSAATLRSGVKRIDVFLDDDPEASFSALGSCAGTECRSHLEETFDIEPAEFDEGTHTIHVRAIDGAGNRTPEGLHDFEVDVRMDDSLPTVTLTPSEPGGDGSFTVDAVADDGTSRANADSEHPYGSGVARLEPYVDGKPYGEAYEAPSECPQGGCNLAHTFTFGPDASLTEHKVTVQAVDFSDQSDFAQLGVGDQSYEYFGYNDAFNACCDDKVPEDTPVTGPDKQHRHLLETSQIGGANIARFPITINSDFNLDDQLRPIFESIKHLNRNGVRMYALPVIQGPVPLASIVGEGQQNNNLQRYRSLINYIADTFGDDPGYGLIGIEAFNEPNLEPFWDHHSANGDWLPPTPIELAEAVNAVYQGIANAAPSQDVRVVLPGMSPFRFGLNSSHNNPFQVLPIDDKPTEKNHSLDAIALTDEYLNRLDRDFAVPPSAVRANSLHLYANTTPTFRDKMKDGESVRPGIESLFFGYMNRMRDRVSSRGYSSEEWITEVGFPSTRTNEQRMSTQRCRGNKSRELSARTAPSECRKTFRPTIARQYSRMTRTFMRFEARNSLKMLVIHRFYDDVLPFDGDPGDDDPKNGKDGRDEGDFGVWPTYDVGRPKRARDDGEQGVLYCALNDLQDNRLAPYSEIPPSFGCRRREAG